MAHLTISDIAAKKIATYICLIPYREKYGKPMQFQDDVIKEIKNSYEYQIACKIYQDDEEEMVNLARLLLINKDIDLRSSVSSHLSEDILQSAKTLLDGFISTHNHLLFHSEIFEKNRVDFESVIIRLILQNRYDHTGQRRLITYTETGENNLSPLALEYTRLLILYLENQFNEKIRSADTKAFSVLFHSVLKKLPMEYQKMRLAVFSMEGRSVAELMKDELSDMYGNYIDTIDVFNLYEMRRIDFKQYDATVSSWDVAYYRYPVPLISYKGINRKEDKEKLFHDLFIHGFSDRVVRQIQKIIRCYKQTRIQNYMELIQQLAEQYGRNEEHAKKIVDKAVNRFSAVSYYNADSGISMIFLDYEDTEKEILDIYIPDETIYWGTSMEIRYFITVCLNPEDSLQDICILNKFLHVLFRDRKIIEAVIEHKDEEIYKVYESILYESV